MSEEYMLKHLFWYAYNYMLSSYFKLFVEIVTAQSLFFFQTLTMWKIVYYF